MRETEQWEGMRMQDEKWLEEGLLTTNRLVRLMPSSVLQRCIDECHKKGISLQTIANVSHQLGLVDATKLATWKEVIPQPYLTLPSWPGLSVFKEDNKASIERCRFLAHYLIGAVKEILVSVDWQPQENVAKELGRVIVPLTGQIANINEERKENENGNRDSNST